ncbi:MAG: geranylgeranyl reductase family protein [Dehalococcoidia bacterium]|nr:geranylgeranyl reductase family protein [Dehalococcoidia bacterium]
MTTSGHDVVVIGAGPAGSAAAYFCAVNGLRTLLLEASPWPREKVCGGGLTPWAMDLIDCLVGLGDEPDEPGFWPVTRLAVRYGPFPPLGTVTDRGGAMLHVVSRSALDAFLVHRAMKQRVQFLAGFHASRIRDTGDPGYPVAVDTFGGPGKPAGSFPARFVIGADGIGSVAARYIGLPKPDRLTRAIECHLRTTEATDEEAVLDAGAVRQGYAWSFPAGTHLSLGIGSAAAAVTFWELEERLAVFARRIGVYLDPEVPRWRWSLPIRDTWHDLDRGRVCVAGDAAGLVDPITGEGIGPALLSGMLAGEAVVDALDNHCYDQTSQPLCIYSAQVQAWWGLRRSNPKLLGGILFGLWAAHWLPPVRRWLLDWLLGGVMRK